MWGPYRESLRGGGGSDQCVLQEKIGNNPRTCVLFLSFSAILNIPSDTTNKSSCCALEIRSPIRRNLLSYHKSTWTCASNHILSHTLEAMEDNVPATALDSECHADNEPWVVHNLSNVHTMKKQTPCNGAIVRLTFAPLSYGPNITTFRRLRYIIVK